MVWTAAALGAALLIVGVICIRKRKLQRGVPWLMLLAGTGLTGILGAVIGWITGLFASLGGAVTRVLFDVAAPGLLAIATVALLVIDMHPKKGQPHRYTPWLALIAVPLIGATLGGAWEMLPDRINDAVAAAAAELSDVFDNVLGSL